MPTSPTVAPAEIQDLGDILIAVRLARCARDTPHGNELLAKLEAAQIQCERSTDYNDAAGLYVRCCDDLAHNTARLLLLTERPSAAREYNYALEGNGAEQRWFVRCCEAEMVALWACLQVHEQQAACGWDCACQERGNRKHTARLIGPDAVMDQVSALTGEEAYGLAIGQREIRWTRPRPERKRQ